MARIAWIGLAAVLVLVSVTVRAASPGIRSAGGTGTSAFSLTAQASYITQPGWTGHLLLGVWMRERDNANVHTPSMQNANCPTMQIPGPTLIVNEGDTVTVTLTNNLPIVAGNHPRSCFPVFKLRRRAELPAC